MKPMPVKGSTGKQSVTKQEYKEYANPLSPDYIKPKLSPFIAGVNQSGKSGSVMSNAMLKPAVSSKLTNKSDVSIKESPLVANQGLSLSQMTWGGKKFEVSSSAKKGLATPESKSTPGSSGVSMQQSKTQGSQMKQVANVFSHLDQVDRANLVKMKSLISSLRIDSVESPQYRAKLQEWFKGKLPKNVTFDVLKKSSLRDIQFDRAGSSSQVVGYQGLADSRRSLNELLSRKKSTQVSQVEASGKQVQQEQVKAPLTQQQIKNNLIDKAVNEAFLGKKPNDYLVSLTLPNKAKDLAQQDLIHSFKNEVENNFALERPSLIKAYKKENAKVLDKIQKNKGPADVDARINRVMYERLTSKINKFLDEKQQEIDIVGVEAKDRAKHKLQESQSNNPIARALQSGHISDKGKISQVKINTQNKKIKELKDQALKDFKKDTVLLDEVAADYKDQFFKERGKLPELKDVSKAIDDYFNLTVMSGVRKQNKAIIDQVGKDAVSGLQTEQSPQNSFKDNVGRRGASPVGVNNSWSRSNTPVL